MKKSGKMETRSIVPKGAAQLQMFVLLRDLVITTIWFYRKKNVTIFSTTRFAEVHEGHEDFPGYASYIELSFVSFVVKIFKIRFRIKGILEYASSLIIRKIEHELGQSGGME
ncbi:MAG: hypothetical protein ACOZF0_06220 [Thermodesulfobacteriota bacterium]